jgi:FkbM family methyltransferase
MGNLLLDLAARTARWMPDPLKKALYHLGPLTRALRTSLNRVAPSGLTQVEVSGGDLRGLRLELDLQAEKDYWLGTYELELQAAIRDWVQPGATAYDLGANIGYVSLLLERAVGESGRVLALEALPDNLKRLAVNIELNHLESQVQIVPGAVADQGGTLRFLVGPSGGMGKAAGSAGRDLVYPHEIEVQGIVLDELIFKHGSPPPQVIKMDIEGGEVLALAGMPRTLAEIRPVLLVELHGAEAAQFVWEKLAAAGYQVRRMQPGYPLVASLAELDWKAYIVAHPAGQDSHA